MQSPRVSILLPTYNRGNIIGEAIDAAINQKYQDWELIILDDHSSDNTSQIGNEYSKKYPNILYNYNKKNIGQPGNRNIGISLAKGELIFFIEDDLILDKECLMYLVQTYDELKSSVKVGGVMPRLFSELEKQLKSDKCDPIIFNKLTGEMYLNYWIQCDGVKEVITTHACTLYPKSVLIEAGGYPENIYIGNCYREESDLNFRVLHLGYHFFYQSKAWAHHKVQKSGGCRDFSFMKFEYFKIRNHIVFLIRIFKLKALYMIPLFIMERLFRIANHFISKTSDS
jgi:glycosyltransferase involved in cell wall biosynthesis